MKWQKLSLVIACMLSLLLMLPLSVSCEGETPPTKVFTIGLITSITGDFSAVCKPQFDSIGATEALLNQIGGITVDGQQYEIQFVAQDDQSSPTGAVTALTNIMQQGIKYVVPSMFPPANLAMAPTAEEEGILRIMAVGLGKDQVNADTKYNFYASATIYNIEPAYDYFVATYPDLAKIALVLPDDPETTFVQEHLVNEVEGHGLQIVFNDVYAEGTQDFYPILTKALAENPDAIDLGFCIPPWAQGLVTGARDLGFTGPIYASLLMGDPNVVCSMLPPDYAYDIFCMSPDVTSPDMPSIVKDLVALLQSEGITDVNMDHTTLLEAVYPLLQVIKQAQSFDTTVVADTFENMTSINTIYGLGYVNGLDIFGINHVIVRPVTFSCIVNGQVEFEFIYK